MKSTIDGVMIRTIRTHQNDGGFFREILRSDEGVDVSFGQLSHSLVPEGVVKAWHGHVYQCQWTYIAAGQARVALLDRRENSPTRGEIEDLGVTRDEEPFAYYLPPGVFHGYSCVKGPMTVIYLTSGVYDPAGDEQRIAWDYSGVPFEWKGKGNG